MGGECWGRGNGGKGQGTAVEPPLEGAPCPARVRFKVREVFGFEIT